MLTSLDWTFIALLALSCLLGLWRGLVWEAMSLAGWFVAGVVSYTLADHVSPMLAMTGLSDTLRYGLAFILLFIASLLIWGVVTAVIKKAVGAIGLGLLDRLLGGAFGIVRGGLILVVLVSFISHTPIQDAQFWQASWVVKNTQAAAASLKVYLPSSIAALIP